MVTVNINDIRKDGNHVRSCNVPEEWNELTRKQLLSVAEILYTESSIEEKQLQLVCALFDIKPNELSTIAGEIILEQLFPLVDWLTASCNLTTQLIPKLEVGLGNLYGPDTKLANVTLSEFNFSELELFSWMQDKVNLHKLWRFVACLYRPCKPKYWLYKPKHSDIRKPYDDYALDAMAMHLAAEHPPHVAFAIVLWYKGCRDHIVRSFPKVFSGGDTQQNEPEPPNYFPLIRMIAKAGTYGNFEKVEQLLLENALLEIESSIIESERLREQVEQNRKNNQ